MPSTTWTLLLANGWLLIAATSAAAQTSGEDLLIGRGLTRSNRVWMLPLEVELRGAIAELPKQRDRTLALERELDQRIDQNRTAWQESRAALQALQQTRSKLRTDDPQRLAIDRQIATVDATAVEPSRLGSTGDVRTKVVAWSLERNSLMVSIRFLRAAVPRLQDEYAALARDPQILAAIKQAGEKQRLGPQRSYQNEIQKLGEYERLVFTPWTPLHWQGGLMRITGLVDDRTPLTFSFLESGEHPTVLTTTAVEAAGIVVPADAPQEVLTLSAERQVTARRVDLSYLRFGGCELRGVAAYVLPPEAEDWGCRIGRTAFGERAVRLEPERLRLWIEGG